MRLWSSHNEQKETAMTLVKVRVTAELNELGSNVFGLCGAEG